MSAAGDYQCRGQMQYLETFDYPRAATQIADDYATVSAFIGYWGGSLPALSADGGGFHPASVTGPPAPGSTNSGGGGSGGGPMCVTFNPPASGYTNCETYTNFWLKISQASNSIQVVISNTLPGMSYLLLEKTNLLNPYWTVIQELTATNSSTTASNISAGTNAAVFFTAVLTTNDQAPVITQEPSNQVVALNGKAVFQVTATGLAPLAYQWQLNGANISGATASQLTLSGVPTNKLGTYSVIVSNAICSASAAAGLGLSWTTYLTNPINASPAIGPDGTIFISTTSSQFLALDPVLGKIKWCVPLVTGQPYELTSSAAVAANGRAVYVGSQDSSGGFLYAFNPTNGAVLWRTNLGGPIFSSPAINPVDGTIYACTYNPGSSALFAVTPTGSVNWQFQPDDPSSTSSAMDSSPALSPDCSIVFLSTSGNLYDVNPDGSLKFFFPLPAGSHPDGSPAIDASGNILICSHDGYVYCITPFGGLKWIFDTGDGQPIQASVAIGSDSTVYAASTDGTLYAITNGGLAWKFSDPNGTPFESTPAVTENNVVIVGSEDYSAYGIAGGTNQWSLETGNEVLSSPNINPADGAILISSMDGNVYKIPGSGNPAANSPWPMFHQNARHTGATPNATPSGGGVPVAFPNNPGLGSDGAQLSLYVSGTPGSYWAICASSNLATWDIIGDLQVDPSSGNSSFIDTTLAGVTNRFYQLRSQAGCSQVFGLINMTLPLGTSLIADQLYQVSHADWPQNTAQGYSDFLYNNTYLCPVPYNLQFLEWNGTGFDTNTYNQGTGFWQTNGDDTLLPGEAVFFVNSNNSPITLPFAGLIPPGLVTNVVPPGTHLVSSILPQAGLLHSNLNYSPNNGDTVGLWTGSGYSYHTYSASSGTWSGGEPSLKVGEGFLLTNGQTNVWIQGLSACQPGTIVVTANPVWTDTGYTVTNGDTVIFPVPGSGYGTWTGDGQNYYGPSGNGYSNIDTFLAGAPQFSLIAFVGANPYYGSTTNNQWTSNNTYFPRQPGQGYWELGTTGQFTTTNRSGELWFGFNDDGESLSIGDNYREVVGQLQISGP
jgi:outer membrane protein assembly factor BamB